MTELTLTKPNVITKEFESFCQNGIKQNVYGICVFSSRVELAVELLSESNLKVTASIGGFMGNDDSDVKRYETEVAVDYGAQEIEVAVNTGRLLDGDSKFVLRELRDVVEAADERIVKVDLIAPYLTPEAISLACELVLDSGAKFITSRFVDLEQLKFCREALGPKFGIKAMSSNATKNDLLSQIQAGATRIGIYGHFFPVTE